MEGVPVDPVHADYRKDRKRLEEILARHQVSAEKEQGVAQSPQSADPVPPPKKPTRLQRDAAANDFHHRKILGSDF